MKSFSTKQLEAALHNLGIKEGDFLMVQSSLFQLGLLEGCQISEIPAKLYETIRNLVGESGTIAAPTYNFSFCKGEEFDRKNTPSRGMGDFSEYVRTVEGSIRSPHPMQPISAVGPQAQEICNLDTVSSFGINGPFEYMIQNDAKLLFLGASIQAATPIHYSEERVEVPYRYWKKFTAPYRDYDGSVEERTYQMYVRELDSPRYVTLFELQDQMERAGTLQIEQLGSGTLMTCKADELVAHSTRMLEEDPYSLTQETVPGYS